MSAAAQGAGARGAASEQECAGQAEEQEAAKQPQPARADVRMHFLLGLAKNLPLGP